MPRYHVSEDGVSRICKAASAASCTAVGVDGEAAPHGEFTDGREAQRFAESVLERTYGDQGLGATAASAPAAVKHEASAIDYEALSQDERIALVGKNPEADQARYDALRDHLDSIDRAHDLGSAPHPDHRNLMLEEHALGQSLGRESRIGEMDKQRHANRPLPPLRDIYAEKPRANIGVTQRWADLNGIQRDLDERRIGPAEGRARIAALVERLKEYESYDETAQRPESVAYRKRLEELADGAEPAGRFADKPQWKAVVDGIREYQSKSKYSSREWRKLNSVLDAIHGQKPGYDGFSISQAVELTRDLQRATSKGRRQELKDLNEVLYEAHRTEL